VIKLGLDVHGVIDRNPVFFSRLTNVLHQEGSIILIVTGRERCKDLMGELESFGIVYTEILSITSHQKALGTPICYLNNDKTQPVMDPEIWNPTKAALCASFGIDIMIDDSPIYGKYFMDVKTQYIMYTPEIREFLELLFFCGG